MSVSPSSRTFHQTASPSVFSFSKLDAGSPTGTAVGNGPENANPDSVMSLTSTETLRVPGVLKAVQRLKERQARNNRRDLGKGRSKSVSPAKSRSGPPPFHQTTQIPHNGNAGLGTGGTNPNDSTETDTDVEQEHNRIAAAFAENAEARRLAGERVAEAQIGAKKKAYTKIAIIGAGPVGLWLALLLCRSYYPKGKEHVLQNQIAAGFFDGKKKKRSKSSGDTNLGGKSQSGPAKADEDAIASKQKNPEDERTVVEDLENLLHITPNTIQQGTASQSSSSTFDASRMNKVMPPLMISSSRPQSRAAPAAQRASTPAKRTKTGANGSDENEAHLHTPSPSKGTTASERGASSASTTSPGKTKSKISFADAAKLVVTNSDNERSGMGRSRGFSVSVSPSKFAAKTYGSNPESNSLLKIHIYEKRPLKSHATRNILLALSTQTESLLYRNMSKATHAWSPCAPLADLEKSLRQELEKFWWPCVKFHWDSAVDLDEKVFSKLQTKCEESWYDHKVVENVGNQLQVEKDENEFLMFDDDAVEKTAELLEQTTLPSFSSAKAKLLANGARNPAFGAGRAGCGSTGSAALNALRANNSASLVDSDAESISRGFEIDGNTFDAAFICSGKSAVSHLHKKMNITKATILSYRKKGAVVPKELKEKLKAEQAAAAGGAEGVEKQEQSSISEFRSIQDRKYNNPLLRSENIIIRELGTYGWVWLLRYEKPIVKRRMPAAGKAKDSKQADAGGGGGNSPTNGSRKANKASGGQKSGLVDADAMCDEQQHQATKRPTKAEQEEQENEDPDGDQEKQEDASAASAIDELKEHLEATAQPTPVKQFSTFAEMTSNVDNLDDPDTLFAALEGSIDYEKAFGISVNVTEANHWGLRLAPRRDRDVSPNRMQAAPSPKRGTAGGGGMGGEQSQRKNSPSPSAKSGSPSPKRSGSVSPPGGARGRGGGAGVVQGMIGGASSVLNSGVLPDVVVALPRGGRAKAKEESDTEQKNDTVICFAGDALCGKPFYLGTTLQFHLHDMNFLVSNVNWTKGSALSAKDFRAYESRMRDTIQGFLTQKNNSIAKPVGGGGSSPSGKAKNADGTPAKTPRAGAVAASGAKTATAGSSSSTANASLTSTAGASSPPQHQRIAGSSATSSSSASGGASEQDGRKERESTPGVVSIPKVSMLAVGADGKVTEESCAAEEECAEETTSCLIAPPASPEAAGASARASLQLVNKTNVSGISNSSAPPAQQQGRGQHASGGNRPGTGGGGDNDVDSVPDAAEWSGGENGDVGSSCGSGAHSFITASGAVAGLQGALAGSRGAGGKTKIDLVSSLSGTTTVGEATDEHSCTSSSSASLSSSSSRADPGRGAAARRSGSSSNLEQSARTTTIGHPQPTAALGNGSSGSVSTPGSSAGTGNKARSLSSISVVDPAAMGSGETSSSSASSSSEAAQADAHSPPALGYAGAHPARPVTAKEVLDQIIEARNTKHVPAKWIGSYSSSSSAASASTTASSSSASSSRIRTGAGGGSSPSGVTGTAGLTGQGHPSTPMAKARARVSSIFAAAGGGGASPSAGRSNQSATSVPGDYVDDDRREVMNRRALATGTTSRGWLGTVAVVVNDRCEHPTQLMEEYERQKEKSDFSNSITRGRPSPGVFASNRAAFGSGTSAFADAFNLNGAARSPLGGADAEGGAVISGSGSTATTTGTAAGARGSVISRHGLKMGMSGDLMKDLLLPTSREAGGVAGGSGSPGKNRIRALSDLTATETRQLADDDPIHRRNEDFLSQFFVKR